MTESAAVGQTLESFETLAEFRLLDGWTPRFQGAQDPDQEQPWPYGGGFEAPWEPASAYLADQGLALNGPGGHSEVVLWRGLEWRHYRFDAPLASVRLDPRKGGLLLVTLALGQARFETRLLEIPEGRVLWATDSGPWSRFSWDGQAVLLGLAAPAAALPAPKGAQLAALKGAQPDGALLLATLPTDGDRPESTLAPWDEKELPSPPRGWPTRQEQLWDDGKDLTGARILVPWPTGSRLWFPLKDKLWVASGTQWTLWSLDAGTWHRQTTGIGLLMAQPPLHMGLTVPEKKGEPAYRLICSPGAPAWEPVPDTAEAWPAYDPAWLWWQDDLAATAWDNRWGKAASTLPPERQRQILVRAYRSEWRTAMGLRASVKGWIPQGPETALREAMATAWVWVGDRALLVRLNPTSRLKSVKTALKR